MLKAWLGIYPAKYNRIGWAPGIHVFSKRMGFGEKQIRGRETGPAISDDMLWAPDKRGLAGPADKNGSDPRFVIDRIASLALLHCTKRNSPSCGI
ncbi:MAG TPA: hypothetical protein VN284_07670 [Rhizobium sp.]|nr:hypothetical protein [Rhizobium sp.]